MSKQKSLVVSIMIGLLLSSCTLLPQQKRQEVSLQNESSVVSEVVEVSRDIREIPTLTELQQAFVQKDQLQLGEPLFSTTKVFEQRQQLMDVQVKELSIYPVNQLVEQSLFSEFNFESEAGAVILMKLSIHNQSDDLFYFPIEEMSLSFDQALSNSSPSTKLYPLEFGNLAEILLENNGEVAAKSEVEGYLVYGIGKDALTQMKANGNFYVTVVPPRAKLTDLIGAEGNHLGTTLNLFLPMNDRTAEQLSLNSTYIQDRLTTEWWGDKEILASEAFSTTQQMSGVSVKLLKMELSDFKPRLSYEDAFQNFAYGQIIVSVEYEVTNHQTKPLLPVDGTAILTIEGDPIRSDYTLINQFYGIDISRGETYRAIKTFALDKKRYLEVWQQRPINLQVNVPFKEETANTSSNTEQRESTSQSTISAEFTWQPNGTLLKDEKNQQSEE